MFQLGFNVLFVLFVHFTENVKWLFKDCRNCSCVIGDYE